MVDALHAAGHPGDGGLWHCYVRQRHLGRLRHGKLLNVAGCGGVVGGAGEGGVGDGVLKGGQSVLVFTVTSSLLTALELLPELRNLFELVDAAPGRRALVGAPLLSGFLTPTSRSLCGFIFHTRWIAHMGVTRPLPSEVGPSDSAQGGSPPNGP